MDNDNPLLVGLDVGTTKICALVGETDEFGGLRILGVGLEPARGMRKGVVVNVEEASNAIANAVEKAQRSAGYEIGAAFVSLAGSHISSVNSRGVAGVGGASHGIDQDDIERALDAAQAIAIPHGREVLHVIPRGFSVDGQESRVRYLTFVQELIDAASKKRRASPLAMFGTQAFWVFYMGCVLYWLHDSSPDKQNTLAFLDRSLKIGVAILTRGRL